jgi:hypothetical protein
MISVMIFVFYNSSYHTDFQSASKTKKKKKVKLPTGKYEVIQTSPVIETLLVSLKFSVTSGTCFGITDLHMGGYQLPWKGSLGLIGFFPKTLEVGHLLSLCRKGDLVS